MASILFILVFPHTTLAMDYSKTRHTALFLEEPNLVTLFHAIQKGGDWVFEERPRYDARNSLRNPIFIKAAELPSSMRLADIQSAVKRAELGGEPDWNCQDWVYDALAKIVEIGGMTEAQRQTSFDEMITICLQAEGEQ